VEGIRWKRAYMHEIRTKETGIHIEKLRGTIRSIGHLNSWIGFVRIEEIRMNNCTHIRM